MKKQYFKCALAVFTAIMTVLTVLILPAGAKSAVVNVQTWDFKQFDDVETEGGNNSFARLTSKDGSLVLGKTDKYWNTDKLTIKDGAIKAEATKSWSNMNGFILNLKLDNTLFASKTYTFKTNLKITRDTSGSGYNPNNLYFYYSAVVADLSRSINAPDEEGVQIFYNVKDEFKAEDIGDTYTFTPTADMVKGGYLVLRFGTHNSNTITTISEACITETVPYAENEDLIVADDWDFTKLPKVNYANDTERSATVSSDNRISLETTSKFWNQYSSLEIKNGKVTTTSISYYHDFCDFVLNLQLSEDLVSGKEYTFATDLTTTGKWVTPVLCYTAKVLNGETKAEDFGMSNEGYEGVELYRCEDPKGEACNNFTVKFTATDNMKAGGWLNVRFDVDNRVTTTTVSKAELLTVPTENEVTNSSVTAGEKFTFDGAEFKTGSGYKLIVNYNAAADAVLKVYEGETEKILGTLKAGNTSASLDYVCGNTSPEFFIEGTGITVSSVSAGEYIKALAPDSKIDDIKDENRLYTKIILPEINSELKTYYMVTNEGEIKLDGNVALNLAYDTEYTFVARYKDSYRFYANGDAVEAQKTVKTRRNGDVTGDDCVDIRDLVRLKNGLALSPENELYILATSGGDSLTYLRKVLLGVTD